MYFPGTRPCGRSTVLLCTPATYFPAALHIVHILWSLLPWLRWYPIVYQPAPRSHPAIPMVSSPGALYRRTLWSFHAIPCSGPAYPFPLFPRNAIPQLVSLCSGRYHRSKLYPAEYPVTMYGNQTVTASPSENGLLIPQQTRHTAVLFVVVL